MHTKSKDFEYVLFMGYALLSDGSLPIIGLSGSVVRALLLDRQRPVRLPARPFFSLPTCPAINETLDPESSFFGREQLPMVLRTSPTICKGKTCPQ